ncbi:MAG: alpha/beta hydrolase family protein, partial [Gemmataceae bacterium]
IFKAGVDMKGVHDWSLRTEYRLTDTAAEKETAWLSSPDSAIATWRSPVLLVQGDNDRNVDFHQMVDLVRRLQLQHVPYQAIVIPDEIHGFLLYHARLREYEAAAGFFDKEFPRFP